MHTPLLHTLTLALLAASPAGGTAPPDHTLPGTARGDTLAAFASEREFLDFLRRYAPRRDLRRHAVPAAALSLEALEVPAADMSQAAGAESITNVQHAGVDEGGIVKLHGDHLIILRRGRLFTVAIGDRALRPVSAVDAFGPDVDPHGTWYDELIAYGDVVAVVGYSYARGGTEVGLFRIDRAGRLRHASTYQLRSNDYYSSRNYASRLVGSTLVFYAPVELPAYGPDPASQLPALRRWREGARDRGFRRILPATRVYHAGVPPEPGSFVLHTVTLCDLARSELACDARAVVGPHGRVFYVSPSAVYIWTSDWRARRERDRSRSMLYRMPLDGSAPSALRVSGSPVDQFSFLEDGNRHLNVLVRSEADGDGMWRAELARGDVALMQVPLSAFSDGSRAAPASRYRALPRPVGHTFQNRFAGRHLLYGTGSGWGYAREERSGTLYTVPLDGGEVARLELEHGVDRIEVMGPGAVVVGSAGNDLHFTSIRLGRRPAAVGRYTLSDAAQGELRSHGFFYRADAADSGILGLPVRRAGGPGHTHLVEGSAGVLFLRNAGDRFQPLGQLTADASAAVDDACRASCVDWYGNARPLFLRGRILALLGYEIVEGSLHREGIREQRRVSFAPSPETYTSPSAY